MEKRKRKENGEKKKVIYERLFCDSFTFGCVLYADVGIDQYIFCTYITKDCIQRVLNCVKRYGRVVCYYE